MAIVSPGLIIFDCDGVLVDSELLASRVLAETLTDCGFPIDAPTCRRLFTETSIPQVMATVAAEAGRPLPADFEDRLWARDRALFAAELKPIAGIAEALAAIPIPKCVASSGAPRKIRLSLALTGLDRFFGDCLFSALQVPRGKPAPDLFLFAAREMDAVPETTVVVEDSVPGVRAARAAGMRVFGFTGGSHAGPDHGARLQAAGATRVFAQMASLPAMVASPSRG